METLNRRGCSIISLVLATAGLNPDATGPWLLTLGDLGALAGIADAVIAAAKFFSSEFVVQVFLDGAVIKLCLFPKAQGAADPTEVKQRCDDMVDALERNSDLLRENAQALRPLPPAKVVRGKNCLALFKTLAAANDEESLHVFVQHSDGTRRSFPIPETAELSEAAERTADSMVVNAKVRGLVRGEGDQPCELIIEGGTRVVLPERSPWLWTDIHLLLESANWIEGTLVRVPKKTNKWTVGDDVKIVVQAKMI
jgi:hypothetical protein